MDFVLALHSHLPYVLNHGRWPHGSDWICEAAIDTYLPLLDALQRLEAEAVAAPLTIGITPILANQLESPDFVAELEAYFFQKLTTCDEAVESLTGTGDAHLIPLAEFWRGHLLGLRQVFRNAGGNLARAFRRLEEAGRVELISCGATHGFLPLLARDESIRLQLQLGRAEHRRIFGRDPQGLWLPECAYRPRGHWAPLPSAPNPGIRAGIEEHVAESGFRYFFVDSHLAAAGQAFKFYGADWGEWRMEVEGKLADTAARRPGGSAEEPVAPNTPYEAYRVAGADGPTPVSAFVRDPVASRQVWSKQEGYPGDEWYLEFHKIRWPGGLKYWRVSAPGSDLGQKEPYDPSRAIERVGGHARHFAGLLGQLAGRRTDGPTDRRELVAVPFDTELFGHWWFEGVEFLSQVYRAVRAHPEVHPVTAGQHLAGAAGERAIHLTTGSWGANGDFSMWLNGETAWTWPRLWAIEERFWRAAPAALAAEATRPVLAQAARAMLLAMSSDWQFIISTGAVTDYAVKRFTEHCDDAEGLLTALEGGADRLPAAQASAAEQWRRDHVFPDVLDTVAQVLAKRPAPAS